jgi:hypothetical protein
MPKGRKRCEGSDGKEGEQSDAGEHHSLGAALVGASDRDGAGTTAWLVHDILSFSLTGNVRPG